jgi:Fur family iron response transcriptional regulator
MDQMITRENVSERLRAHGINPTHQRIEIAYVMFARCEHLSADQILALVNARFAESSKATVYNTLKLFHEKKLVRQLIVDSSKVVYDPNTTPHHHFYDVTTGRISDIPFDGISISGMPAPPPGHEAEGIDIVVRTRPMP